MSVKSKNGRLAARVLVAMAGPVCDDRADGSACSAEGPRFWPQPSGGTGSGGWHS